LYDNEYDNPARKRPTSANVPGTKPQVSGLRGPPWTVRQQPVNNRLGIEPTSTWLRGVMPPRLDPPWKSRGVPDSVGRDVRCWAGFEHRVVGLGPALARVEVATPSMAFPQFAGRTRVLAVMQDDRLELRHGLTGEVRSVVPAPYATDVHVSSNRLWLVEEHRARPVTFEGQLLEPVDLHGGSGHLAASERWLVTARHEAYDYSRVLLVSATGKKGPAITTRRLMNPNAAGVTSDALIVAHDGGVERWPLDGRPSQLVHKPPFRLGVASILAPADPATTQTGWYLAVEDVLSQSITPIGKPERRFQRVEVNETTQNRLVRFDADRPTANRSLERRAVRAAIDGTRVWLLTSKQDDSTFAGPAGSLECRVFDDQLNEIDAFDFGDLDWRGGFAVCSP
jgi:hypothetical protein